MDPQTSEGKRLLQESANAYNKAKGSCDSIFSPIKDYRESHTDYDALFAKQYEDSLACAIEVMPSLRNEFDAAYDPDTSEEKMQNTIDSHMNELPADKQEALGNCMMYQTATPRSFGKEAKPMDQLTEQERKDLIAQGKLVEQR